MGVDCGWRRGRRTTRRSWTGSAGERLTVRKDRGHLPRVERLEVFPREGLLQGGERRQLIVTALFFGRHP